MAKKTKREDEEGQQLKLGDLILRIDLDVEAKNPNNAYFRSANTGKGFKGMFMKKEYKEYKDLWIKTATERMSETELSIQEGPIGVISYWTFGTKRRKDLQNCGKLEYDALNGIIYNDDDQILFEAKTKLYKKNKPSISLEIYQLVPV
jgi:Holliday junction resolvase RusA-like endonuclease